MGHTAAASGGRVQAEVAAKRRPQQLLVAAWRWHVRLSVHGHRHTCDPDVVQEGTPAAVLAGTCTHRNTTAHHHARPKTLQRRRREAWWVSRASGCEKKWNASPQATWTLVHRGYATAPVVSHVQHTLVLYAVAEGSSPNDSRSASDTTRSSAVPCANEQSAGDHTSRRVTTPCKALGSRHRQAALSVKENSRAHVCVWGVKAALTRLPWTATQDKQTAQLRLSQHLELAGGRQDGCTAWWARTRERRRAWRQRRQRRRVSTQHPSVDTRLRRHRSRHGTTRHQWWRRKVSQRVCAEVRGRQRCHRTRARSRGFAKDRGRRHLVVCDTVVTGLGLRLCSLNAQCGNGGSDEGVVCRGSAAVAASSRPRSTRARRRRRLCSGRRVRLGTQRCRQGPGSTATVVALFVFRCSVVCHGERVVEDELLARGGRDTAVPPVGEFSPNVQRTSGGRSRRAKRRFTAPV